jgi:hypothetical protein
MFLINLIFFESVIWTNTNDRGLMQVCWYRILFISGTGNALLGFTSKYKWNNNVILSAS